MNNLYPGGELADFALALNWKGYIKKLIEPFLKGKVLEVGAGIGGVTSVLCDGTQDLWVCLEPDERLFSIIKEKIQKGILPSCCEAVTGTIQQLEIRTGFDTILYLDVIEHISDDQLEIEDALKYLVLGGHIIVIAPAHEFLWSPFDEAVKHLRRYSLKTLAALTPPNVKTVRMSYIDSVGVLASLANKFFLRKECPKLEYITIWDKVMIPMSRKLDGMLRYRIGKHVLGIWRQVESN